MEGKEGSLQADKKASFNRAAVAASSLYPFASSWQPVLASCRSSPSSTRSKASEGIAKQRLFSTAGEAVFSS